MSTQQMNSVVLVDLTGTIDPAFLSQVSSALDQQVTRDLATTWSGISAHVKAVSSLSSLRRGDWPVYLVATLPPGEGGYHQDKNKRPYAKVIASADDPSWTVDASHEVCEMLVDPYGSRLQASNGIMIQGGQVVDGDGTFEYLVEACDPCEANNFAYEIAGVAVSDFITPNYYDSDARPGVRYSFQGNITRPRQMLEGGYISFVNAADELQQILWVDTPQPVLKTLGPANGMSLREHVHLQMGEAAYKAKHLQRRKAGGLRKDIQRRVNATSIELEAARARAGLLKTLHRL
ncbi:hypothetical protein [Roseateles saccharophilus]|uniref:Uncharacterized protein n=1 Tax=Roseateles saccharophilus TaxID=304 RepID=A0A4R3U5H7_ROSSA|nr:hypothetical protein [Roseateles saccharophilus]MDG0836255.1 hypothetical protein [Roseateles saccharophilus]TCU81245.1 hypothetical protein EV671_10852 [Roseateles saccharophilus]